MNLLTPVIRTFDYTLQPIIPFTWFSLNVSTLDVLAAFRLGLALRQMREILHKQHVSKHGTNAVEDTSFVRKMVLTLTVVYGGEIMSGPMLGFPPSFFISPVFPSLFVGAQAIIDAIPAVPPPSLQLELPLAFLDALTRAFLLCSLIPPSVTAHTSKVIALSPWTLLLTSLVTANGGFFLVNLLSFLHPTPLTLTTPQELLPYGWTNADLWCAPLITGLYALLTHAQPFWAEAHTFIVLLLGGAFGTTVPGKAVIEPVDPAAARAGCAFFLCAIFVGRVLRNFGVKGILVSHTVKKIKTQ